MPKYYLLRSDNSYSDVMESEETPPSREDGQWVEGDPPLEAAAYSPVDQGSAIQALLGNLSDAQLLALAPLIAEGKTFMDAGRWGVVLGILRKTTTSDPLTRQVVDSLTKLVEGLANG